MIAGSDTSQDVAARPYPTQIKGLHVSTPQERGLPTTPTLPFTVTRDQTIAVVGLRGELDPCTSPRLNELVEDLLATGPLRVLVLDLAQVTFASAAAIRALLLADRAVTQHAGRVILREPSHFVRRVLIATGDIDYFHLEETSEGTA